MGVKQSKTLIEYTKDELADAVTSLGTNYVNYSQSIRDNGVDGEFVTSINEEEFIETLTDLDITNRLHIRILTKTWKDAKNWKKEKNDLKNSPNNTIQATTTGSTSATPTSLPPPDVVNKEVTTDNTVLQKHDAKQNDDVLTKLLQVVEKFHITPNTPKKELIHFERIVDQILQQFINVSYAGVHLLSKEGHQSISNRIIDRSSTENEFIKIRAHAGSESFCHKIIENESFGDHVVLPVPKEYFPCKDLNETYEARVLKDRNGDRYGAVCVVTRNPQDQPGTFPVDKDAVLQHLAQEAEQQLEMRKVLLQRNQGLQNQINDMKEMHDNQNAVASKQGGQHNIDLAGIAATAATMDDKNDYSEFYKNQATPIEMSHIPPDFYAPIDAMGSEHCPITAIDMERVATLELLGLKDLQPHDPLAIAIQGLTDMGKTMFEMLTSISILDHKSMYNVGAAFHFSDPGSFDKVMMGLIPIVFDSENVPFMFDTPRCLAACNYAVAAKKTFTVHDLWAEKRFLHFKGLGLRFYSGSPVIWRGHVVATFCLLDDRLRPDFGEKQILQQEQFATILSQHIDNWFLRKEMEKMESERRRLSLETPKPKAPSEEAAIVFTDFEGSTRLLESAREAIEKALQVHDIIIRDTLAENIGYEIYNKEGAFCIAFHDALDAVNFALKCQELLYQADWDSDILSLPDCCLEAGCHRGIRVKMGIHYGPVTTNDDEVTGMRQYTGATVQIAKSLGNVAHGGQILVSSDVWNVVSHLSESALDSPQIMDLGIHVILTGNQKHEGVIAQTVLQLVPSRFAFDYEAARSLDSVSNDDKRVNGRVFPPVNTVKCLSPSFLDAPYKDNKATIVFLYTTEIEKAVEDCQLVVASLVELVGVLIGKGPGYHCKDNMLAFGALEDALNFGLTLQETLQNETVLGNDLSGLLKVGVHEGEFTSMSPHRSTGRADYFGVVVNRAARVAAQALPGHVYAGVSQGIELILPDRFLKQFMGEKQLKGVKEMFNLYSIRRG